MNPNFFIAGFFLIGVFQAVVIILQARSIKTLRGLVDGYEEVNRRMWLLYAQQTEDGPRRIKIMEDEYGIVMDETGRLIRQEDIA